MHKLLRFLHLWDPCALWDWVQYFVLGSADTLMLYTRVDADQYGVALQITSVISRFDWICQMDLSEVRITVSQLTDRVGVQHAVR